MALSWDTGGAAGTGYQSSQPCSIYQPLQTTLSTV